VEGAMLSWGGHEEGEGRSGSCMGEGGGGGFRVQCP